MATLLLTAGGYAAGGAIGGAIGGGFMGVGAASIGASAGAILGGMAGQAIDGRLFAGPAQRVSGPRLSSLDVALPAEGAPLPQVAGWARVPAKMIWRTRLEEVATTETAGGKGAPSTPKVEATSYSYFGSALFALCEGAPGLHFGRVWADGRKIDAAALGLRFYNGAEDQAPEAFIEALDGIGEVPAYRGVALMMAERLPLAEFGDRFPNIQVEVCNPVGDLEPMVRGLTFIPGNEWGLATTNIRQETLDGEEVVSASAENGHRSEVETDFTVALRQACDLCPNLETVTLVLTWFGTDLRAGECEILPKVELVEKRTAPLEWSVAGVTRDGAAVVSTIDGRPAFGSSPADASVLEAIAAIKASGKRVTIYPFVIMDVPVGNALPDPYGAAEQPPYPWRGRITSTGDKTAQAAADVAAFFNRENGYRRFALHLAALAAEGGADAFCIGTELRGLTWLRDGAGAYPAVAELVRLADDVRAVVGAGCKIGYAADWSEYFGHQPGDGSGDVFFHLDPLWSSPNVDFIGIDNYMPLSDWRDGVDHLDYDAEAGVTTPYALDYLQANVEGGEGFAWFYASDADRAAQLRTPISDGAAAEPWVFRFKDLRSWWSNPHHDRPGGVRSSTATAWVPESKPIWFTELGFPAVDKGANQPNVFIDPKSSESFLPYFSSGRRDDYMQRRALQALLSYWTEPGRNPVSGVYGGPMLATGEAAVWTCDVRPWPEFPDMAATWADGPNYRGGHWLRLGRAPLAETIRARLTGVEGLPLADLDLAQAHGQVDGVATDRAMSFREFLSPWETALRVDAFESYGRLVFQSRVAAAPWGALAPGDLAESGEPSRYRLTRTSIEDPPREALVRFPDSGADWQTGAARAAIGVGFEEGLAEAIVALGMDLERADAVAAAWLRDVTEAREGLEFDAPPSWVDLEAGRPFAFEVGGRLRPFMVESVTLGAGRRVVARGFDQAALRGGLKGPARPAVVDVQPVAAPPVLAFMDLPRLSPSADAARGYVAAHADPWLGVDLHRARVQGGPYALHDAMGGRTPLGRLEAPLAAGPADRWTPGPAVARLFSGELLSRSAAEVLGGANALAVEAAPGVWEVLQFQAAELTGARVFTLRGLLRGRLGTEAAAGLGAPSGARVVALGLTLAQPPMTAADIGRGWWWRGVASGRDPMGDAATESQHAFQGVGLRPFAPYALAAQGDGAGGAVLTWLRRSREPGRPFASPPLGEDAERYLVRVRPAGGGDVIRAGEVLQSMWTYAAAERSADALGASFMVEVAQVSAAFGPGAWARAVATV